MIWVLHHFFLLATTFCLTLSRKLLFFVDDALWGMNALLFTFLFLSKSLFLGGLNGEEGAVYFDLPKPPMLELLICIWFKTDIASNSGGAMTMLKTMTHANSAP